MIEYVPTIFENPARVRKVNTAWIGLEKVIKDIIVRFKINPDIVLEFGVERGYSTTALANYFRFVVGVDIFQNITDYTYEDVKEALKSWDNIYLEKSSFENYITKADRRYDLIHIDIIHNYEPTFNCGDWSVQHSNVVIFHDTLSYPAVMKACEDLAVKHNLDFYNYPYIHGLGILVKK